MLNIHESMNYITKSLSQLFINSIVYQFSIVYNFMQKRVNSIIIIIKNKHHDINLNVNIILCIVNSKCRGLAAFISQSPLPYQS